MRLMALSNNTNQFGSVVCGAVIPQATRRLLRGEPRGTPIQLLRRVEPKHLTQIGLYRDFDLTCFGGVRVPASNVAGKRSFFNAAMNSSFFEGFECRRLSVSQSRLSAAFRKNPASPAGLD
jgi:hypothetical protein